MKIRSLKNILVIGLLFSIPMQAMSWGLTGHRVVGEIADSYLKANARIEIKKILGNESLAMASNWADFVKADPTYSYLSSWHFVNLDRGLSLTQMDEALKRDTTTNAYAKITALVKELKNNQLHADKKRFYVRVLVHLLGDIHQPMHIGNRSDRGGNDIKLTWGDKPSNLHAVWDDELIDCQKLSYTEYVKAINTTTDVERKGWVEGGVREWLYESYQLSDVVYASAKSGDVLGYKYNYAYITTVNQQLVKAGVRLASLLNEVFGGK